MHSYTRQGIEGFNAPLYPVVLPAGSQPAMERLGEGRNLYHYTPSQARKSTMIRAGNHVPISLPPDMQKPDNSRWISCTYDTGARGMPGKSWAELAALRRRLHTTTEDTPGPSKSRRLIARAAIDPEGLEGGRLTHKHERELGVHVIEHDEENISSLHGPDSDDAPSLGATAGDVTGTMGGAMGKRKRAPPKDPSSAVYRRAELCRKIKQERGISLMAASSAIRKEGLKY